MASSNLQPLVILAAGGTAGHLFPAQALAAALAPRGVAIEFATDGRAGRYEGAFATRTVHIVPSGTPFGRNPLLAVEASGKLAFGLIKAWSVLGRVRPGIVVGFGGYPTIPTIGAAILRGIPTLIHEQNAVMGRANGFLAGRVTAIATSFPDVLEDLPALAAKATLTGNPVRPAVVADSRNPYPELDPLGPMKLLVFGGSQGARVMADVVPPAIERLAPRMRARLSIVQQARDEDIARVQQIYSRLGITAEIASFFPDLPARMAAAHLVISRAGASTVAELAVIGRPSILVPLPHALDQDQLANASALARVGGAVLIKQSEFTPDWLAAELTRIADDPDGACEMAAAARSIGAVDAAERLAALVLRVAGFVDGEHRT